MLARLPQHLVTKETTYVGGLLLRAPAAVVNRMCKMINRGVKAAAQGEYLNKAARVARELGDMSLDRTQANRERMGGIAQTSADWVKWGIKGVSMLLGPAGAVIATVSDATIEAAKKAEELERQAERANISVARQRIGVITSVVTNISPLALSALSYTLSVGEDVTAWTEARGKELMDHPERLYELIERSSDQFDSRIWKIANLFEGTDREPSSLERSEALQKFVTELSEEEQDDLLYIVCEAESLKLKDEDKALFRTALSNFRTGLGNKEKTEEALKDLIARYESLDRSEKFKMVSSRFDKLDELSKIHMLHIVFNHAKLTPEENRYFLQFQELSERDDWNTLDDRTREELEARLLQKFNKLNKRQQGLLYGLSFEQYRELDEITTKSKTKFFEFVLEKMKTKGTAAEKNAIKQLDAIRKKEKEGILSLSKAEITFVLDLFQKYCTLEEKKFITNDLRNTYAVVDITDAGLQALIEEQTAFLETLESDVATKDKEDTIRQKEFVGFLELQRNLRKEARTHEYLHPVSAVVSGEREEAIVPAVAPTPTSKIGVVTPTRHIQVEAAEVEEIDIASLPGKIGSSVVSGRVFKGTGHFFGNISATFLGLMGHASYGLFKMFGKASAGELPGTQKAIGWIQPAFNIAALVLKMHIFWAMKRLLVQ